MENVVYCDYNATAPLKPAVIDLMTTVLAECGNASSVHGFGRQAHKRLETAREDVAALVSTLPNQVIFTSGATEANNAVLNCFRGQRVLISAIEHPSVKDVLPDAEIIPVTTDGVVDEQAFEKMLSRGKPPALISVMLVNNETGVIQPIAKLSRTARSVHKDVFFHTDAVQAPGRLKIDFPALYVDYMSLSAHKFGGPQGVGALITAPGAKPARLLLGGGQEKYQRAGTENVAGIAGMGMAAQRARQDMQVYQDLELFRDRVEKELSALAPALRVFGQGAERVANTSSLCLPGVPAETQLMSMDLAGVAVSSGSACSSGKVEPSHVLKAMGASAQEAASVLRLSLGWGTTSDDIDRFITAWTQMYERVKDKVLS